MIYYRYTSVLFAVVALVTVSPSDDWLDPNLPSTLSPLSYVLWIHPEFYDSSAAVFHGRVEIEMEVNRNTRTIIVHYKSLNITSTTLTDQLGDSVPVCSLACPRFLDPETRVSKRY